MQSFLLGLLLRLNVLRWAPDSPSCMLVQVLGSYSQWDSSRCLSSLSTPHVDRCYASCRFLSSRISCVSSFSYYIFCKHIIVGLVQKVADPLHPHWRCIELLGPRSNTRQKIDGEVRRCFWVVAWGNDVVLVSFRKRRSRFLNSPTC